MSEIVSFDFDERGLEKIKSYQYGTDWPVVYVQENQKEAYVGEAVNLYRRSKEHLKNPDRQKLRRVHVMADEEYNKSAALDIESSLIQYLAVDGKFSLQNGNKGLKNHSYYDREKYKVKFEKIWETLQEMNIAVSSLRDIRNSDLFKYSPYKALNDDQDHVVKDLFEKILLGKKSTYIVSGKPGTGKTILATYLMKYLAEDEKTSHLKIGLVIPMTGLRKTLKKVFKDVSGLSPKMVLGPSEVVKNSYDLLIVDEAHRLSQRRNIAAMGAFDNINKKLGFDTKGHQLDWVISQSRQQILFYDSGQSVRPSDVSRDVFVDLDCEFYDLRQQMRVQAGDTFISFVGDFFELEHMEKPDLNDYDIRLFDDLSEMVDLIKEKDRDQGLSRLVAGYAWKWISKDDPYAWDICIGDVKLRWNSVIQDWVNSDGAVDEVGCIHTVQGYDLNYVGVIVGPELSFDPVSRTFLFNRGMYKDINGHRGIRDDEKVKKYVINIYKTLLTRGIRGVYVYVVDENLREYFREFFTQEKVVAASTVGDVKEGVDQILERVVELIKVPLVGSAPCGNPLLGQDNIERYVDVEKSKLNPAVKYFIVEASGDSMDRSGIKDGDLLLCRASEKAETGDRVVALLGGENVTVKYYDKMDGKRVLLPKSSNPIHQVIVPEEGDEVQGIVQEVLSH